MSELRKDPVLNRWVVIAPERGLARPDVAPATMPVAQPCPFCPGNEGQTPPEIRALSPDPSRAPNAPGWSQRVIPNRLPLLRVEGELHRRREGPFEALTGIGANEVIIESPDHAADLADLTEAQLAAVLWTWSERLRDLSQDVRLLSGLIFRSRGTEAGARLAHPHSQLVAFPIVPPALAAELGGAADYFKAHRRCGWCDVVEHERANQRRLVLESDRVVVITPWASRRPFELMLLPRDHGSSFERAPQDLVGEVASVLRRVLRRLMVTLEHPAWTLVLHTAPLRDPGLTHYHWHIELWPAIGGDNGVDAASGGQVNPVPPEEAARILRKIDDR